MNTLKWEMMNTNEQEKITEDSSSKENNKLSRAEAWLLTLFMGVNIAIVVTWQEKKWTYYDKALNIDINEVVSVDTQEKIYHK